MTIFDKSSITNPEYNWFKNKLDANFTIQDNQKSKIIFGFNGIGKTTIFKCIKEMNNSDVEFLEYFNLKDTLIEGKDIMTISSNINQIIMLQRQIEAVSLNLNSQQIMKKSFGFTKQGDANFFGTQVLNDWKNKSFSGYKKSISDIKQIEQSLNGISPKAFISAFKEIGGVQTAQQELQDAKDNSLFNILNDLNNITYPSDSVCPICDNNAPNLKNTIQIKMTSLSGKKSILVEKLQKENVITNASTINTLIAVFNKLSSDSDLKEDYILCGGDSTVFHSTNQNYNQVQQLNSQVQQLTTQAQTNYNNLINVKERLEIDLKKYFYVNSSDIVYDSTNFTIKIKFPRELNTYSTGEMNLISFLYRIYTFIGSDKNILLLDDPVSSLDLVNHYKIAYEIVRNTITKTMIVLTHSVELINVINSQYPGNPNFEYYYLEQINGEISIILITINQSSINPNIITMDKLTDTGAFNGYINACIKRELEPTNINIQDLFHYSIMEKHLDGYNSKFSNFDLISLIDNFSNFTKINFYKDSYIKLQYISALRIWLEKKLFDLIPTVNTVLQTQYLNKHTLNDKIECLFPRNGLPSIPVPPGLSRDILMSKKVMLNQGVHYYSQIMPFAYAINLSFDMLTDEINELNTLLP